MSLPFQQALAQRPRTPPAQTGPSAPTPQGGSSQGMTFTQTRPATDPGSMGPNLGQFGSHTAQASMPDMQQFQPFQDAVMDQYERTTQPQLDRIRSRVNQDLVNKGITPGSEAYDREMDRLMQRESDAFSTAQRSALGQALQAQGQFFGQGLGQAQVNAGLKQAAMANDASRYGTFMGSQTSMYNSDNSRDGSLERLIASLGEQGRQFDASHGLASGQADFGNLMQILGYGAGATGANNAALSNDRQVAGGALSQFLPQAPIIPINAGGAYGTAGNIAGQQQNAAANQSAGTWGAIGSIGSAALPFMLSDRNAKTDFEAVDGNEALEAIRKTPVSRWKYKGDTAEHIGPMAQDFGANVNDDPEATTINVIDAFGSLMASVQALADKVDTLSDRMEAANV